MNQPRPTNRLPQPNLLPPQNYPPAGNVQMFNPYATNQLSPSNGSWAPPPSQPHEQQVKDPWNWDDNVGRSSSHLESKPPVHLAHNLNNHPPPMYSSPEFLQNQPVPRFPLEHQHQTNNNQYDNSGNKTNWGWNDDYAQQSNQNGVPSEPTLANNPNTYQPGLHPPPLSGNGFPTNLEHGMNNMSISNREEPQSWESQLNSQRSFQPPRDETASWSGAPSWGSMGGPPPLENRSQTHQFSGLGERSTFADGASFSDGSQVPVYPMIPSSTQSGPNGAFSHSKEDLVSPYPQYPLQTSHPSVVPLSGPPVSEPPLLVETSLNSATGSQSGPPTGPPADLSTASPMAPPMGPPTGPPAAFLAGPALIPANNFAAALSTVPGPLTGPLPGFVTDLPVGPPTSHLAGPPTSHLAGPPTVPLTGPPTGFPAGFPAGFPTGPPSVPLYGLPTAPPTAATSAPLSGSPSRSLTGSPTGPPTALKDPTEAAIDARSQAPLLLPVSNVAPPLYVPVSAPLMAAYNRSDSPMLVHHGIPLDPSFGHSSGS